MLFDVHDNGFVWVSRLAEILLNLKMDRILVGDTHLVLQAVCVAFVVNALLLIGRQCVMCVYNVWEVA